MITQPFFLDTPAGALFAVHHAPAPATPVRGHVLCALPFNEEMNRCRSMVTRQASAWAALGFGTLVLDPLGTGDSAGEFVDARWPAWLAGLDAGHRWLADQPGGCRALWGIRLGAILAAEWHARRADADIALLLWQAVADGKTHLTQFFRVRIAAQIDRPDLPKETTASMREQLAAGTPVEVAGYELHPELTQAIDGAQLDRHRLAEGTRVLWLENAPAEKPEPTPGTQALLARWPGAGVHCDVRTFDGPAFWQVHERMLAPEAVACSAEWLRDWADGHRDDGARP